MIKGKANLQTLIRRQGNSTHLGANDNRDFLCELGNVATKCKFFLFLKLE